MQGSCGYANGEDIMYGEFETRISYKYLKEVINNLEEPICILGGWAVFFHVNQKYEKAQGRPYLGSRDIDLGFHMAGNIKKSALSQTIRILKEKLEFKPLSFRFIKEIHTETEEEIKKGEIVPAHFIFPMYVDLIVDRIPEDFKRIFGFNPIDEPLLRIVFEKKEYMIMKEFEKKLLLPKPELLLAMKINSLPDRDKEHKRIKDICDIFTLAWYTDINPQNIDLSEHIPEKNLVKCFKSLTETDFEKAAAQLGHSAEDLKRVINLTLQH
ncbi:MAG TPA: hypothetical protein VJB90_06025 [Candidatus Nanoarchaeia archaeon]|nr:hypothetical protein [Candidatus Nanoarchaeia archaeon]